jgi:hypothetical protein
MFEFLSMINKFVVCELDLVKDSCGVYKEEDSGEFKTIVSFECKGIEPVEYSFEVSYLILEFHLCVG